MKSILTKVLHFGSPEELNELTDWMEENVGPYYKTWERYVFGKYVEIVVWDNNKAAMVALRWS